MLILTRRIGEALMIGDEVSITILDVKGNQVKVGVNAPKDIAVHREEIYQKIQREKQADLDSVIAKLNSTPVLERLDEPLLKNSGNTHDLFYPH